MGGSSSSTRIVTVNQEESNVATISEDVARRLLGLNDAQRGSRKVPDGQQQRKVTYKSQPATSQEDVDFLEGHYKRRIMALEKQNNVLQQSSEAEFAAAVKDVEEKFMKHKFGEPVCVELQQLVERCYADNRGNSLACVDHVKAFRECVQQHKRTIFATHG